MLKYSAKHIGQTHSQRQANHKCHNTLPSLIAPYKPCNKQVERHPHPHARDGGHQRVHNGSSVEIEPQKKVMVKGNIVFHLSNL